jgi:hypothetical protein
MVDVICSAKWAPIFLIPLKWEGHDSGTSCTTILPPPPPLATFHSIFGIL